MSRSQKRQTTIDQQAPPADKHGRATLASSHTVPPGGCQRTGGGVEAVLLPPVLSWAHASLEHEVPPTTILPVRAAILDALEREHDEPVAEAVESRPLPSIAERVVVGEDADAAQGRGAVVELEAQLLVVSVPIDDEPARGQQVGPPPPIDARQEEGASDRGRRAVVRIRLATQIPHQIPQKFDKTAVLEPAGPLQAPGGSETVTTPRKPLVPPRAAAARDSPSLEPPSGSVHIYHIRRALERAGVV